MPKERLIAEVEADAKAFLKRHCDDKDLSMSAYVEAFLLLLKEDATLRSKLDRRADQIARRRARERWLD